MSSGGLFSFNPAAGETPETLERRRKVAEAMIASAIGQPATTIGGGLSAIGQAIGGRLALGRANRGIAAGQADAARLFAPVLAGFGGGAAAPAPSDVLSGGSGADTLSGVGGGMAPDYRNAIAGIESGGRYDAVGPTNANLGRMLGKYQIAEANVGPWAKAALGREVTPDEFLASPEIQDAVFDAKFGEYVKKYGPEGAAQAWLGGPGAVGKTGREDVLGTSVGEYGRRFTKALGGGGGKPAVAEALSGGPFKLTYANQNATRNLPVDDRLGSVYDQAARAAGIDEVKVTSGGQPASGPHRTGSHRHDLGGAGDIQLLVGGRPLDMTNPADLPVIQKFISEASRLGATGIGAGTDYMGSTTFHVGFGKPAVWGAGGKGANAPDWLREAVSGGGQPAVTAALAGGRGSDVLGGGPMIDPAAKDDLYQPAIGPGAGLSSPFVEPPVAPTAPPAAPPVAPGAPAAPGVAPVAQALGVDPLPQTSGLMGPVASAGHDSLAPGGQAAVASALAGGGGTDALAGGGGRGILGRLFGPRPAAATATPAAASGGGGGVPSAAVPGETAPAAGGFSPRALAAIEYLRHPHGRENERALAKTILDNEIAQADPLHQAQLAKVRYDLAVSQAKDPIDLAKAKADLDLATAKNPIDIARAQEELEQLRNPPQSRDLSPDEVKQRGYDPNRRYQEKPDGTIIEVPGTEPADPFYEQYRTRALAARAEAKAAGVPEAELPPLPVDEFVWRKGGAVNVTTSIGGEGSADQKLRAKLSEKEGERWSTLMTTGNVAAGRAQQLGVLEELLKIAPQGPITGRLAEMFPGFSTAGDAANAVIYAMAPTLRVEGSGATSDIEYAGMLRGVPGLSKDPLGNKIILETMKAKADIDIRRADVISEYMSVDPDDEMAVKAAANVARKKLRELDRASILTPRAYALIAKAGGFAEEKADDPVPAKPEGEENWPSQSEWDAMSDEDKALFEGNN